MRWIHGSRRDWQVKWFNHCRSYLGDKQNTHWLEKRGKKKSLFFKEKLERPRELQATSSRSRASWTTCYLENKDVLSDSQHGSTNGKLCLENSWAFYNRTVALVERGKATDTIYLDLCKAFELPHETSLCLKWRNIDFGDGPVELTG